MTSLTFECKFFSEHWIHCKGLLLDVQCWFDTQ